MKAWIVYTNQGMEEGITLLHAETAGKAKFMGMPYTLSDFEFTEMRAKRLKIFDDKPFTLEAVKEADIYYDPEDGTTLEQWWIRDCQCELCKSMCAER